MAEQHKIGQHLIADFYGAENLDDLSSIERALLRAAAAANATVLNSQLHKFDGGGGVTGVVLLSESHISIHTWPEYGYAAFDIFLCGDNDPLPALEILRNAFRPNYVEQQVIERGARQSRLLDL